ncbi:MAG: hypothetical protein IJW45_00380 [Oscillospiraceae bacterium]|nr:hypothetical protein [Oscillospiraceae bacterium]
MEQVSEQDVAITALAVEAERRRKEMGRLRYNYGDLVADTTPEERRQIVEAYRNRKRRPVSRERFVEGRLPDSE